MKSNLEKTNKWQVLIKIYNESDLTMKEFCQIHKVNVHELQYWSKKFKHESTPTSFVKIINPIYQTQKPLTIDFQDLRINMPESYNESTLIELIKTLRRLGDERWLTWIKLKTSISAMNTPIWENRSMVFQSWFKRCLNLIRLNLVWLSSVIRVGIDWRYFTSIMAFGYITTGWKKVNSNGRIKKGYSTSALKS